MSKKKLLALFLSVVMTVSLALPALASEETETTVTPYAIPADVSGKLVILHTNDTHGADVAVEGTSFGTAGVAALKKDFEAAGAQVLLLSAGDTTQGTPLVNYNQGADAIKFMNAAGYDAMAPGNHEFDWGAENLMNVVANAEFPILAANILDENGDVLFEANKIFELEGLKVGVFGLDTPEAATKTNPEKVAGLSFLASEDLYACAQAQVDELKAAGCDLVVSLGHLGVDEETAAAANRSCDLVNNVTGIDLFVDGHSHTVMKDGKPVKAETYPTFENTSDTLIVSTGEKLANVGVVIYDAETKTFTADLVSAAEYTKVDEDVAAVVAKTNAAVDEALKTIIGKTEVELDGVKSNVRTGETNLGDFATDALLWFAQKDQGDHVVAAITNGGGIRASIPAGDISAKTMNTVFPFGNVVVTLELTGQQILETLEAATFCTPSSIGAFPQVSGITFSIDTTAEYENGEAYGTYFRCANPGTRIQDVTIAGEPLDLEATYTIATNDFSAVGGDTYYAFKDAKATMVDTGTPLDQALADYTNEVLGGVITAEQYGAPAGRITVKYVGLEGGQWYTDAAKAVMDMGLMTSTGNGFDAAATVTRATVFQMLYNTFGKPAVEEKASFTDVEGTWYADSAAWAEDMGLTTGDGTGAYAGDRAVTRAELAAILTRYAELTGMKGTEGDCSTFADAAEVADWAVEGMTFAVGTGIISGKPGNLLDPNGTAIRAELATMMVNFYNNVIPPYRDEYVEIEVPETDGIPAHTIPAVVTMPAQEQEAPYSAVVMLHGTGSNKDEAGMAYIEAAAAMAQCGIASIRFDFMGNGDSTADYVNYNFTSANIDAKAAADYLAGMEDVDGERLAVMGWSQGGTNALLAAAEYPETFKAVITWAGALDLTDLTGDFAKDYATAKKDGYYEKTFDWREPLHIGPKWFEDVKNTDVLKEAAKIEAPILSIHGDQDTTVPLDDSFSVFSLDKEKNTCWIVEGADHTFNVFSGDFSALHEAIEVGIGFLKDALDGEVAGTASSISKYGNVTTDIPETVFAGAGYEVGDILNITVGETTIQAPYGTGYSNVDTGNPIVLADKDTGRIAVAINMGNFAETYGVTVDDTVLSFSMAEKAGYLEEYEIRNIDALRTNVREDYESDEIFANFRNVVIGDIAEGVLYRSSSPVNPELGRNTYADDLTKAAGVKTVINLADSQEKMEGYEGYAESYYATLNVIPLDMGVDFTAEDFNAKLKTGLEYMIANEGPYLIHCTEGKDRAGFVNTLLAAAMGADLDEIVDDYMVSFENYYGVEYHSDRWTRIAQSNVIANLITIAGVEDEAALEKTDLKAAAEAYLTETVGLTAEQVTALQETLSAPVVEAETAA